MFTSIVALPNLNRVAIITDKSDELRFFNLLNGSEDVKPIYLDEELAHLRNIQRRKHFKKFEVQSPQIMAKRNMSGKISGSYPKKQVASAKRRDIERLKSLMTEEAVMELEKMSNVKKTTITAIGKTLITQLISMDKISLLLLLKKDLYRSGAGIERASNLCTRTKMTLLRKTKMDFVFLRPVDRSSA